MTANYQQWTACICRAVIPNCTTTPWLLWVHLYDAHAPYAPPADALVEGRGPGGERADVEAPVQHLAGRLHHRPAQPEPLPDGHPLWSAPQVLITPHAGGNTTALLPRMAALLREQLGGLAAGDGPRHLVRSIVKT